MSKISSFVRAVVGIIILAFLLYKLDFNEVIKAISGFGIIILFLFILKYLFEALIKAMNVKILFDSIGEKISYFKLFRYFIVSYSLGLFSPGRIGDLALIPMLKKEKIDYGKSILVEVVDKFITVVSLLIFSIYILFLVLPIDDAVVISFISILAISVIGFAIFSKKIREFAKKYILRKYSGKFRGFSKNLYLLLREKKIVFFINFILTFIDIFGGSVILYFIFLNAGIKVSPFIIASISAAGKIISLIPITLSGLGVRESVIIYFYSILGISPVIIGSIYIVNIFVYYVLAGILVLFLFKLLSPEGRL